ncbi:MAG: DEAD/DEAH box helicase family protein [Bacteroidales bacterium]|nr:DEAD/DEAH box helicase family protein [Bacteroidales bacterium]
MATDLRDYQLDMLHRLQDLWTRLQSVMVQMPTGTGKMHLMAAAAISEDTSPKKEGGSVSVVVHRRELLEQIKQTLAAWGLLDKDVLVESL